MWVADGRPWWPAVLTVVSLPPRPSASRLRALNDVTRLSDKLPQPDDTWHASRLPAKSWYTVRCFTSVLPDLVGNEAQAFFSPWRKALNVLLLPSSFKPATQCLWKQCLYSMFITLAEAIMSKLLTDFSFLRLVLQQSLPAFMLFNNKTCDQSFWFFQMICSCRVHLFKKMQYWTRPCTSPFKSHE